MSELILNNPNWVRGAEMLYGGQEYTGEPLKSSYTVVSNKVLPGYVLALVDGEFELADTAIEKGAFFGISYSEFSTDIDETNGLTISPVVIRGPGTVGILNKALNSEKTYKLEAGKIVDLIAVKGILVPREAVKESESPTVATLSKVLSDRIIVQLQQPSKAPSGV